jgi:hypothetical protein
MTSRPLTMAACLALVLGGSALAQGDAKRGGAPATPPAAPADRGAGTAGSEGARNAAGSDAGRNPESGSVLDRVIGRGSGRTGEDGALAR